ncbi:MAG: ABC transporter ATP-binding protein [Acidimicrobiales bacterium]
MPGVSVASLSKVFPNGVKALDNLSLSISDGEMFALLGPSGCGKTTLLRILAGLESPSSGRVAIGNRDVTSVPPGRRNVAMVFQDYALFPHMTVADNIAYPLKVRKVDKLARRRRAEDSGGHLGLAEMMDRRPAQLSGGQQQRVALARAIACDPVIFLFDKPLSNLDARLRMEARTLLKRLHREVPTTTVYVTHDQSETLALADRIAVMERGVIRQVGPPSEVFHRPANLFVAQFIGSTPMNLLPAAVSGGALAVGRDKVPLPPGAPGHLAGSARVVIGIRPEYVTLGRQATPSALAAHVEVVEELGTTSLVTMEHSSGAGPLQAVVPEGSGFQPGQQVFAGADWARALLYDPETGNLLSEEPHVPAEAGAAAAGGVAAGSR